MRLIVFLIRSVSFNLKLTKIVNNKLKIGREQNKIQISNKIELFKLNNKKMIALFNSLPNSNLITDFGYLIKNNYIEKSGIIGSLYQYKK